MFLKVGVFLHRSFFSSRTSGKYRIPEASGGPVNVHLMCCNAKEAVDIDNNIDIDIDICFAF